MKVLVVGDPHFRLDYPYADRVEDRRRGERKAVLDAIIKEAQDCEVVVLMGDNLDKRHNHSSVIKEFTDFLEAIGDRRVFIISGNHETYDGTKTAIDFLKNKKEKWTVLTPDGLGSFPAHIFQVDGFQFGFIPYLTKNALGAEDDAEGSAIIASQFESGPDFDVVFAHHGITGTRATGTMVDMFNEIILPRERLIEKTKLLIGGHIHQPSVVGTRTIVTGSIMTQDMGETEKCVWKLQLDKPGQDIKWIQVPLPVRPIHKMEIFHGSESFYSELNALDSYAIVKVINHDPNVDTATLKEALERFDGHVLVEDLPSERTRLNVDEKQTLDMSVESLLNLYAEARNKDPHRLQEALKIVQET